MMNHPTEPAAATAHHPQPLPDAYSTQPGGMQNRVAQADNVAAHHAEGHQKVSKSRHDDAAIQKIIDEERVSRSKFPKYPGLERWELLEKMGDGAFSNVYRARDLQGGSGECAIKVVRKFEMNNMQVSSAGGRVSPSPTMSSLFVSLPSCTFFALFSILPTKSLCLVCFVIRVAIFRFHFYQHGTHDIGRQASPSRLQEGAKSCRGARTTFSSIIRHNT